MSGWAWNTSDPLTKRQFFVLLRQGVSSHAAALSVGVSPSCGSLWFIDAGSVKSIDTPISSRYLSQDDRIEIADGLQAGEPIKQIAARIGKSYQSVYREINRGRKPNGVYQPYDAHARAFQQRQRPKQHRVVGDAALRAVITKKTIAGKIQVRWSPSQISRWLRRRWPRRPGWHLCAETIYDAVYRGLIGPVTDQSLRTRRTYRHKRGRGRTREGALKQLTNLKSIHDRPARVEQRCRVGDWEGDLVVGAGHRWALATLVERTYRFTLLVPIRGPYTAPNVRDALVTAFSKLPASIRRTLTQDQGNEMFEHEAIEEATGLAIYFADPHSPWQRGSNENGNGLIRQYFPKGTDFDQVTDERIRQVAIELNERPRLCLDDRSPMQCMNPWKEYLITV